MRMVPVLLMSVFAVGGGAQDPVEDEVQKLLGKAARYRKPDARVHYLLSRGQDSELREEAVERILVREDGLDEALLRGARKEKRGANRRLALLVLLGREVELSVILKLAVADRDKTVLPAVAMQIRESGRGGDAVEVLLAGLKAKKSGDRLRTVAALGEIGDAGAVGPLREVLADRGCACTRKKPRGVRANVSVTTQVAYVRDYHVEVA